MPTRRKEFLIFFGPPGCGKGTQSDMIGKKLKLPVISPGELLRAEQEKKSYLGRAATKNMAEGKLVDETIIAKILDKRLAQPDTQAGFILDGFPRSLEQYAMLQKRLRKIDGLDNAVVGVHIACSDTEVKKRITGRRVCDCGASYHLVYNPPISSNKCDLCGKRLTTREDDKPAVVAARLKLFHTEIEPLMKQVSQDHKLITVDGDQDIKTVQKEIWVKLQELI